MKVCKECRWWERRENGKGSSFNDDAHDYGVCQKITDGTVMAVPEITELSYWDTWFETREDFGCVLFEPQP